MSIPITMEYSILSVIDVYTLSSGFDGNEDDLHTTIFSKEGNNI